MAEGSTYKRKKSKDVKEAAVETSNKESEKEIDNTDKQLSCDILQEPDPKPRVKNAETSITQNNDYITPRIHPDEEQKEIDFHLTTSREKDSNHNSIFTKIQEKYPQREVKKMVDRSMQMSSHKLTSSAPSDRSEADLEDDIPEDSPYKKCRDLLQKCSQKTETEELRKKLKHMYRSKRISKSNYKRRNEMIDKWVDVEQKKIKTIETILLQGYMKANDIIDNLEKDKHKVFNKINARRGRISPTSLSSNLSGVSNCNSEASLKNINDSDFGNPYEANLNNTTDSDA